VSDRDRAGQQCGQTTTEYAILLGFLAISTIIALFFARNVIRSLFSETPVNVAVFVEVDRTLAKLPLATAEFTTPPALKHEESGEARLLLSLGTPVQVLQDELTQVGNTQSAQVRVSPRMAAHLTGSAFSIEPTTPELQAVGKDATTEWTWEVEGRRPGAHDLHLTLSALITVDGEQTERAVRAFTATVVVSGIPWRERFTGFLSDNWQWLWVAILVPLGGLIWSLWKRRRKPNPPPTPGYGWPTEPPQET